MAWFKRGGARWRELAVHLDDRVETADELRGSLLGVALRLYDDRGAITVETRLSFADRFTLRVVPTGAASGELATVFFIHASPLDLPRFVLGDELRAILLALQPRPTLELADGQLTLIAQAIDRGALEVVARVALALEDRNMMCPR